MRRVLELIAAAAGMVLLAPLFPIIAFAIKLDDGGPIIYSQLRIGKNFHAFRIYKFRTMIVKADQDCLLTRTGDARVTRVGRILRRYKLDELPQLVNVLKGDMQFVGPRPEVPSYVELFRPAYKELLTHRPGITDPASVQFRDEENELAAEDFEERYISEILPRKLQLSLEYGRRRSFWTDIGVLCHTMAKIPMNSELHKASKQKRAVTIRKN